ncbi:g5709 [Coccomyxa elongata]
MGPEDREIKEPLINRERDYEPAHQEDAANQSAGPGDLEAPPEDPENKGNGVGVTVLMTTFIMLGDMLGLGSLTLPSVFARLGWAPALAVIAICALGTIYSGRLFTLLVEKVPNAHVFDDLGGAAMGVWGRRLTYCTVYLTILGEPIIFHLTSMEALQQIFYQSRLSQGLAAAIVAAVMLPLGQIRGIEDVSAVSVLGTLGMLVALTIAAIKICITPRAESYSPPEIFHKPDSPSTPFVAFFDAVFTFGGQVNWMRYVTSMKRPRKFPRAVAAVTSVMTVAYLAVGSVGYYRLGSHFDLTKPLTSILPQDAWLMAANVGLLAHCIVAYMINLNIWTHLLLHLFVPSMNGEEESSSWRGRGAWALVSVAGIGLSWLVSVTFPYFSTVMAIIAALGDLAGAYALPALFVLYLMRHRLPKWERVLCYFVIPISLALSAVGIISSVRELISEYQGHHA